MNFISRTEALRSIVGNIIDVAGSESAAYTRTESADLLLRLIAGQLGADTRYPGRSDVELLTVIATAYAGQVGATNLHPYKSLSDTRLLQVWAGNVGVTAATVPTASESDTAALEYIAGALTADPVVPDDPPTIASAVFSRDGSTLTVTFSKPVTAGADGWKVVKLEMDGGPVTATFNSTLDDTTALFDLDRTVVSSETGTVSYEQPGDGIKDLDGVLMTDVAGVEPTFDV